MNVEHSTSEQDKRADLRDEKNSELTVSDSMQAGGLGLFAQNELLERTTFESSRLTHHSEPAIQLTDKSAFVTQHFSIPAQMSQSLSYSVSPTSVPGYLGKIIQQRKEQIVDQHHVSLPPLTQVPRSESPRFQPLHVTAPDKFISMAADFPNIASFATEHKLLGAPAKPSKLNLPSRIQDVYSTKDDPDIARVDGQLSLFCKEAKEKVMSEIYKLKTTFGEQIEFLIQQERERYLKEQNKLEEELKEMKLLIESYKKSLHYKECIISNLTEALQKQKDKQELMKVFHAWRIQYIDEQREKLTNSLANEYYKKKLKQRVWKVWREIIESSWKKKIEHEVKIEAERSKQCLIDEYETKIKELQLELKETNAKYDLLQVEHKSYEDKMKQALMRGVCALNMEAMSVFNDSTENSDISEDQQKYSKQNIGSCGATSQGQSSYFRSLQGVKLVSPMEKENVHMEYSSLQPCPECLWCPSEIVHERPVKCISPVKDFTSETAVAIMERKVHHSSQPKAISLAGTSTMYSPNLKRLGSGNKTFATPRTSVIVQRHTPVTKNWNECGSEGTFQFSAHGQPTSSVKHHGPLISELHQEVSSNINAAARNS